MPLAILRQRLMSLPRHLSQPRRAVQSVARQSLLRQFESLGENCELGFVQEHLGVHTIGLLRWSGITLENLVIALDSDLAGIGAIENSSIYTDDRNKEYYFKDLRYGLNTHTKMFEHELACDKALRTLCRRTQRLCEKLLEDLEEGRKIFVFQSGAAPSMPDLLRLHVAVRRLGPTAELLCVHPAQSGQRAGGVKRLKPGLMVGTIDQAGFDGVTWAISYEMWLSLLAKAARLCGRKVPRAATHGLETLDLPRRF